MKKTALIVLLSVLLVSFAFAANGNGNGQYQTQAANTIQATEATGSDTVLARNPIHGRLSEGQELRILKLRIRKLENRLRLMSDNTTAETELELFQSENQIIKTKLKDGRNAEVKIMPDTASATALARLRLKNCNESNNCTIELKEVGQRNQSKLAYQIKAVKRARILGLFRKNMNVETEIDAETGEEIITRRPWWAFLAAEENEEPEESEE